MRAVFLFALSVPLAGSSLAVTLTETFESPTYTNGQVLTTGDASQTSGPWIVDSMFLQGTLKVSNERSFGGTQSLKYQSFDSMPPSTAKLNVATSTDPVWRVSVDFYRPTPNAAGGAQLDAMNSAGGMLGSLRFFNGNLLAMDNSGFFTTVGTFTANTWTTLSIEVVSLGGGAHQTRYFKNGTQLAPILTNGIWTDAKQAGMAFQSGGTPSNPTVVFADNLRASTAAVPEPATMAALGIGVAAMIRRRRR